MGFAVFIVILFIILVASLFFVQQYLRIKVSETQLKIEEEKTRQFKLAAGIVDEFDAQEVIDRLESQIKALQNANESQERRAILSAESHQRKMDELHKYYNNVIKEVSRPNPFRLIDPDESPIVRANPEKPLIETYAYNEQEWEERRLAEELRKAIDDQARKRFKDYYNDDQRRNS